MNLFNSSDTVQQPHEQAQLDQFIESISTRNLNQFNSLLVNLNLKPEWIDRIRKSRLPYVEREK